ncbi:CheR family methyltransferase [Hellea balneolensis]|uniref:CheR family methyltransferase n=1 Tax=Hellea balneolensis TaxID=287478 RepID=UPI000416F5C9|nr:CheR family methyltransferase [Hellea balneolensis]
MSAVLSLNPTYYEALKRLTLELAGVNLGSDHAFLIETRLSSLSRKEGFKSLDEMVEELFKSGQSNLAVKIVSSLLERDTHFYTDRESLDKIENVILPALYPIRKGGKIQILSFGCSSGQEAYCIAMALDKAKDKFPDTTFEVIGVDYPSTALDRARAGRYTHFEAQRGLPIRDLITYFDRQAEDWVVKDHIRKMVRFEEAHLLSKLDTLGQFDIVVFRNALPHYSSPAQVRVLRGLSTLVKPLSYLLLGTHETLNHINFGFDPLPKEPHIFIRREAKVQIIEDPNIKKPSDRKTFEKAKRRLKDISDMRA